jgi:large subunit ribosomal protein L13
MPTRFLNKAEAVADDTWFVIDATDQVLGRLATKVATLLGGKHKAGYAPFLITGDHVVVVNAGKVRLTGKKLDQKVYRRHTGYPGGLREVSARKMFETRPEKMIEEAVLGMLPKNKLRKQMMRRLRVYRGAEHPHAAQRPEAITQAEVH